MGNLYDTLFKNFDVKKLTNLYNGSIRYNKGDAYDLDKDYLVFKDIKGQYLPKYTINGLDIYVVPGKDLQNYLDKAPDGQYSEGLWGSKGFNVDSNYLMVKNKDNETFSLIPQGRNISNLYDYYVETPNSPLNVSKIVDAARNKVSVNNRLQYYNHNPYNKFIGGDPDEVRRKFWKHDAIMDHAADSIANVYGIDPDGFKNRMNYEGFVDTSVNFNNGNGNLHGYELLHAPISKFNKDHLFGLDYGAYFIKEGLARLKGNEKWKNTDFTNEAGIKTPHAEGRTVIDNMGMMAAVLKYMTDKAKSDFPGRTQDEYDIYGQAYYNRGETGGKNWVTNGAKESPKFKYYYKKIKKNKK